MGFERGCGLMAEDLPHGRAVPIRDIGHVGRQGCVEFDKPLSDELQNG